MNHKLNVSNQNVKLGFDRRMRVYPNGEEPVAPIEDQDTTKPDIKEDDTSKSPP